MIVSPLCATAIVSRSDPCPLSETFVTVKVLSRVRSSMGSSPGRNRSRPTRRILELIRGAIREWFPTPARRNEIMKKISWSRCQIDALSHQNIENRQESIPMRSLDSRGAPAHSGWNPRRHVERRGQERSPPFIACQGHTLSIRVSDPIQARPAEAGIDAAGSARSWPQGSLRSVPVQDFRADYAQIFFRESASAVETTH